MDELKLLEATRSQQEQIQRIIEIPSENEFMPNTSLTQNIHTPLL